MTAEQKSPEAINLPLVLPRWVVYFQVAMLGIVAATFFLFGLMVGQLTGRNLNSEQPSFDCQLTGSVQYQLDGGLLPDEGAVVFLLPRNRKPAERAPGNLVSPREFQPLGNRGIEVVHQLGGAVCRVNASGEFNLVVDGNQQGIEYFLLIVSANQAESTQKPMTKLQVAAIGTFYLPVERVIDGQAYHWSTVVARGSNQQIPTVLFRRP